MLIQTLFLYLAAGIYTLLLYFPNKDYLIAQACVSKPWLADWPYYLLILMFCVQIVLQWPVWAKAYFEDTWL
jgi:hypothetical protein